MTAPEKGLLIEIEGQQAQPEESTHTTHHNSANRWHLGKDKLIYVDEILCEGTIIA
jgi:hypothetical protein